MLLAVVTVFGSVLSLVGQFLYELNWTSDIHDGHGGTLQSIRPMFVTGIAISLIFVTVKIIRKVCKS